MWRGLSPLVLFLCIYQILGSAVLVFLTQITGYGNEGFDRFSILITGITGILTIIPAWYLYKKDRDRRVFGRLVPNPPEDKLNPGECGLLLLLGAGLAFYVNLFVGILQIFVQDNTYQNMMESITTGYSLWEMILWMGIVAPMAEETIFRWLMYLRLRDYMKIPAAAIISGVIFGIFHGNFVQIIYAGILGTVMAYILEMSGNRWSSVLLHIGANVFSLILTDVAPKLLALEGTPYAAMANTAILILYGILLAAMLFGIFYFAKKGKSGDIGQFKKEGALPYLLVSKTSSVKSFIRKTLDRGVFLMYIHTIPRRGVRRAR